MSGVRNERQRVSGGELFEQEGDLPPLVVLVEARRWRPDVVPTQEPGSVAGVLRGDERDLAEDPERTQCDVFQVSDGRCDDVQRGRHGRCRGGTQVLYH